MGYLKTSKDFAKSKWTGKFGLGIEKILVGISKLDLPSISTAIIHDESCVYFNFAIFQALPIERCPTFRDQPPGSTATYNGKCYIFYNQQPSNFQGALEFCDSRGGSLVDESNPALQGFLSWELWRRHKGDANGQVIISQFFGLMCQKVRP